MRFQRFPWSCGSATIVNAFKCFGINLNEHEVISVAGTIPPSKCKHCKELESIKKRIKCDDRWKCDCPKCTEFRRVSKMECDSGTTYDGLLAAVRHFGADILTASEYKSNNRDEAWRWMHGTLLHGRVVILCTYRWSHWSLAFGTAGDRIVLFDPQNTLGNKREHGVHVLTKERLMKLWYNGCKYASEEKSLYAISVGKK